MGAVLSSLVQLESRLALWPFALLFAALALYALQRNYCNRPVSPSGFGNTQSPNARAYLPGMDVETAFNNRQNNHAKIADSTPQEQRECSRLLAEHEQASSIHRSVKTMNQGVQFGMPTGFRTGAHQIMGNRSAVLGNWDHRAVRPGPVDQGNSTAWGSGSSFSNVRNGAPNPPARGLSTHPGQSSYPSGMKMDHDRVDYDMERLSLDSPVAVGPVQDDFANLRMNDLGSSTGNGVRQHSQAYPPGMNNHMQDADRGLANLRIDDQEASPADNGNPSLRSRGNRNNCNTRGGEDI